MEKITILGNPVPLRRPRFNKRTGKAFNSQKKEMHDLGFLAKEQWSNDPIDCIIKLNVVFCIKIPKNFPQNKRTEFENKYDGRHHDLSNYIKFIEDALNGIVWEDDSLIVDISARKVYSDNPRTEFTISKLRGNNG